MSEKPIVLDFETDPIISRPHYPPKPAGVAVNFNDGKAPVYWSWGHPTGNNCNKRDAQVRLSKIYRDDRPLLFHNGKFDVDVGETHLRLPRLEWQRYHDTLFLAFLDNPHRTSLSLGPLTVDVLRRSARFKDGALRDWVLQNVAEARRSPRSWGAHIAKAPANLVAVRAVGDALNTGLLFDKLYASVVKRNMGDAYDRERRIMPVLLDNERQGIHVDMRRLKHDLTTYERVFERVDAYLRRLLKTPDLDLDKGGELADALDDQEKITDWVLTKKGNRSTAKQALLDSLEDRRLLAALLYRGALATFIRTFMRPWLRVAEVTGGVVHTQWNQVRQDYHGSDRMVGARTGRLSSTPNFQNVPNPERIRDLEERIRRCKLPADVFVPLPRLRSYIIGDDKDHVVLVRDYSQQELRIFAHYEDGKLLQAYHDDPRLDMHSFAQRLINNMLGTTFDRRPVKDTGFGLIYGMGVGKLAKKTEQDVSTARQLKNAYMSAMPGIKLLDRDLKARAARNKPITTWGGREYHCEPPKIIDGKIRTFEYKLLNVLIQGSAADNTKEALARWGETRQHHGARFMLTVHDELVFSAPRSTSTKAMRVAQRCMESVRFDLPMLSDGKMGRNWHDLKKLDESAYDGEVW